jgi:hypothetical protein
MLQTSAYAASASQPPYGGLYSYSHGGGGGGMRHVASSGSGGALGEEERSQGESDEEEEEEEAEEYEEEFTLGNLVAAGRDLPAHLRQQVMDAHGLSEVRLDERFRIAADGAVTTVMAGGSSSRTHDDMNDTAGWPSGAATPAAAKDTLRFTPKGWPFAHTANRMQSVRELGIGSALRYSRATADYVADVLHGSHETLVSCALAIRAARFVTLASCLRSSLRSWVEYRAHQKRPGQVEVGSSANGGQQRPPGPASSLSAVWMSSSERQILQSLYAEAQMFMFVITPYLLDPACMTIEGANLRQLLLQLFAEWAPILRALGATQVPVDQPNLDHSATSAGAGSINAPVASRTWSATFLRHTTQSFRPFRSTASMFDRSTTTTSSNNAAALLHRKPPSYVLGKLNALAEDAVAAAALEKQMGGDGAAAVEMATPHHSPPRTPSDTRVTFSNVVQGTDATTGGWSAPGSLGAPIACHPCALSWHLFLTPSEESVAVLRAMDVALAKAEGVALYCAAAQQGRRLTIAPVATPPLTQRYLVLNNILTVALTMLLFAAAIRSTFFLSTDFAAFIMMWIAATVAVLSIVMNMIGIHQGLISGHHKPRSSWHAYAASFAQTVSLLTTAGAASGSNAPDPAQQSFGPGTGLSIRTDDTDTIEGSRSTSLRAGWRRRWQRNERWTTLSKPRRSSVRSSSPMCRTTHCTICALTCLSRWSCWTAFFSLWAARSSGPTTFT